MYGLIHCDTHPPSSPLPPSLLNLVASLGKQYIVWQEIFDNGLKVSHMYPGSPEIVLHKEMHLPLCGGSVSGTVGSFYANFHSLLISKFTSEWVWLG